MSENNTMLGVDNNSSTPIKFMPFNMDIGNRENFVILGKYGNEKTFTSPDFKDNQEYKSLSFEMKLAPKNISED